MLKIGVKGRILNGRYKGWYVLIKKTKTRHKWKIKESYYVYYYERIDSRPTYDNWFWDYETLLANIGDLEVEWLDE